jgi:hypothetical protein
MVEITLKEISAQNNKNIREQEKQTGFLKTFVESMRIANDLSKQNTKNEIARNKQAKMDAKEAARERSKAKQGGGKDPFNVRIKNLADSIKELDKGINAFKLPKFLKKILFGTALIGAISLIYKNWDTIKETWDKISPKLIELKDVVVEFVKQLEWSDITFVTKLLLGAWAATKLWLIGQTLVYATAGLIGGLKAINKVIWAAAAFLPGVGGGGRGKGKAGMLSRLGAGAKSLGLRVLAFTPLLGTLTAVFAKATTAITIGLFGSAAVAGGGALAVGGALLYLGVAALFGVYKTIRDTNRALKEASTEQQKKEVWKDLPANTFKNITDAILWPFQWAIAESMKLMNVDPAKIKTVEGFSLGQIIFFDFPQATADYIASIYQKTMGRYKTVSKDEKNLEFKNKAKLFVEDYNAIPDRLRTSFNLMMEQGGVNFKNNIKKLGAYIKQIPERALISAQEIIDPIGAKAKRYKLDRELADIGRDFDVEARLGADKIAGKKYNMGFLKMQGYIDREKKIKLMNEISANKTFEQGDQLLKLTQDTNAILLKQMEFLLLSAEGREKFQGTPQVNNYAHPDVKLGRDAYVGGIAHSRF